MIRLTDEEKAEVYNRVLAEGGLDYAPSGDLQDRTAEAQLKKVVEELEKHFEYIDASIKGGSRGFFFSEKEWQALLEEVKG